MRGRMDRVVGLLAIWTAGAVSLAAMGDQAKDRPDDRQAIAALSVEFANAFNAGDHKKLASLFTADARVIDEDGEIALGPDAIGSRFAANFKANQGLSIKIDVDDLRFVGPETAVETGKAEVRGKLSLTPDRSRYTVIYVKQGKNWLHADVQETAFEASPREMLRELSPLAGDWVSEGSEAVVHLSYRYDERGSFLLSTFRVKIRGVAAVSGSERLGWDPLSKRFKLWVFDSQGGHSEGFWSKAGPNQWIVKLSGVDESGQAVTATRRISWQGKDRIAVQVTDRTVSGTAVADQVSFVIARKPPEPTTKTAR